MAAKVYGLVGKSLSHSFSKRFFTEKFQNENLPDHYYQNFELKDFDNEILGLKAEQGLRGFNVTIPYKESILPYLDGQSDVCQNIKSCNCVRVDNGLWYGYNTDVIGFQKSFEPHLKPYHQSALVLGSGGGAKAICYVLGQLGIKFLQVSRTPGGTMNSIHYSEVSEALLVRHKVVINTTPLGMFPNIEDCPSLPYNAISSQHYFFDLIYNPALTKFLSEAQRQGAFIKNGAEMLKIQAEESWKIWFS